MFRNFSQFVILGLLNFYLSPLAIASSPEQQQFESAVFAFPNPSRGGIGTIHFQALRDGSSVSVKIYTVAGDLVRDEHFDNLAAGTIINFAWNAVNQSGKKVGRGLYLYAVRETDPVGVLQTIKKLAVIQ